MSLGCWLCRSIFRIPRSRTRNTFRNVSNVALEILHVLRTSMIQSFLFPSSFSLDQRISSLDLSFSGHRARRGPTNCHEGCNEWLLIFWICFSDLKNGKLLLLFCHCALFSNMRIHVVVWSICMPVQRSNPISRRHRGFALTLR